MATQLAPLPIYKFTDANGVPLVGGQLFTYAAGTTTPLATYTDSTGSTPNTNPVILDSTGSASVWIGASAYKFVLEDVNGVVQWTKDNISYINAGSITNAMLANMGDGTFKGRVLGSGSGVPVDLTDTQATANLNAFIGDSGSGGTKGLVPAPAIGDGAAGKTLHADGTWSVPSTIEVVFKNYGEYFKSGVIQAVPQFPWSAPTFLSNPDTIPTGNANACHFSSDMNLLAVAHTTTPFISAYTRSGTTFNKLPDPVVLPPGNGQSVAWSPGGDFLAVACSATAGSYLKIYIRVGATLVDISPSTGTLINGTGVAWSPSGLLLAVATDTTPFVTVYEILQNTITGPAVSSTAPALVGTAAIPNPSPGTTPTTASQFNSYLTTNNANLATLAAILNTIPAAIAGFGGLSAPSTLPAGAANAVTWSHDGQFLVVSHATTPFITIYQKSGTTFTKLTNPAILPASTARAAAFSPDNSYLVVAHDTTPFITIYSRSGTTFTKVTNPTTLPAGNAHAVTWSPNGKFLAIGHDTTPYITIYSVASGVFTKITDPVNLVGASAHGLSWSANGKILAVAAQTSPYIDLYATASTLPQNATLYASVIPDV